MKNIALLFALCAGLANADAHAAKSCDELKMEIADKLDKKGVKGYVLAVVANDQVAEATVVGSCDGGTKKITYVRK